MDMAILVGEKNVGQHLGNANGPGPLQKGKALRKLLKPDQENTHDDGPEKLLKLKQGTTKNEKGQYTFQD